MDERGLTIDPNRDPLAELEWYEEIGSTDGPSPYATAAWTYWHDFERFPQNTGDGLIFHTVGSLKVYDGKASIADVQEPYEPAEVTFSTLLGEINYEIVGALLTITDWSHYNWRSDLPVRKAFTVLVTEVPECVNLIAVRDTPDAFWRSLGFRHVEKGDDILFFDNIGSLVVPY